MASLALLATATGCANHRRSMPAVQGPQPTPAAAPAAPESAGKPAVKPVSTGWDRVQKALHGDDPQPPADKGAASHPVKEPRLMVVMAQMHERSGNVLGAQEQYERALKADPDYLVARISLARLHDRQGNFAEATRQYTEAARRHPNNATVQNDLGLCYMRQEKPGDAVAALQLAVKLQPDRKLYRSNLGTALVQVGRVDDAVQELTTVNPPAVAHYNVGYLLQQHGQNDAARRQFIKALEYDPGFTQAQYWVRKLAGVGPSPGQPTPSSDDRFSPLRNAGPRYQNAGDRYK